MIRRAAFIAATTATATALACSIAVQIWSPGDTGADPLFRFIRDGKAGFIDTSGKILMPPRLDVHSYISFTFHNSLLRLPDNKFIDRTGRVVIDRPLAFATDFADGMSKVTQTHDGPGAWMDTAGALIYPPAGGKNLGPFSEGLAHVEVNGRYAFVDKAGHFAISPQFLMAHEFHGGMARVVPPEGTCLYRPGICGMLPVQLPAWPPRVLPGNPPWCKVSFIDTSGRLLSGRYDDAVDFSEGYAAVKRGEQWGVIDSTGKLTAEPRFQWIGPFSEGVALAAMNDRYTAFITPDGKVVLTGHRFQGSFHSGRAKAAGRRTGVSFIDKSGQYVINEDFAQASDFIHGLAHVQYFQTEAERQRKTARYAWIRPDGSKVFEYTAEPVF